MDRNLDDEPRWVVTEVTRPAQSPWGQPVPQVIKWGGVPQKGQSQRFNDAHDEKGKFAAKGGGGGGSGSVATVHSAVPPITADEARGDSRPVSAGEFQRIAAQGKAMLAEKHNGRSPIVGLDSHWDSLKASTYAEVQKSWGGATIDSHTGLPLQSNADAYALSVKPAGVDPVSVSEDASREEFGQAMDNAKESFRSLLENQSYHLGVFHDDEHSRIDIDPVLVVKTLSEVEAVGAYTHAIGGAYHFKSGDGFWPPHVAPDALAKAA